MVVICSLAAGTGHTRPLNRDCDNPAVGIARDTFGTRLHVCAEHADHFASCPTCQAEGITVESRTDGVS